MKLYLVVLMAFLSAEAAFANQFGLKCMGQDDSSRQVSLGGMIDQGGFFHHYKFAGAYQVEGDEPVELQTRKLADNQYIIQVYDSSGLNGFDLILPFVLNEKFQSSETSFEATAVIARLDGVDRPVLKGEKLECQGTILEKNTSHGFGGFFEDLGEGLAEFLAHLAFPQFDH